MKYKVLFSILASVSLVSCLPSANFEVTGTSIISAPPCKTGFCTETPELNQTAYEGKTFEYDFTTSNAGPSYYVTNRPSWMQIDSARTLVSGVPDSSGTISGLKVSIYDGVSTEVIGPFDINVIGDPLAKYAWHLKNSGQKSFSSSAGTSNEDINLGPALIDGFTGVGVRIAVSDTGVEHTHEDLTSNLSAGESYDYSLAAPWLGDSLPNTGDDGHGTAVTGLICAEGWNGLGSRGIAPNAKFAAFKFIGEASTTAKYVDQASHDFDIYNYSYGYSQCSYYDITGLDTYKAQVELAVENYRGGKGSLYVKSAGNDFLSDTFDCSGVSPGEVPFFGNANADQTNSLPQHLMVGALNAKGDRSSYSSPGSNLWISAPGGEYGDDSPAMVTTDMAGCADGLSLTSADANAFEKGTNSLNTSCNYTSTMNGTSSAAPVASGVIALMLEANPLLTWRDVKHILASTATVINSSAGSTSHPWSYNLSGHTYQQGWVQNSAGYRFHNWYGFGRINASAAVSAAENYTVYLPVMFETKDQSGDSYYLNNTTYTIPDRSKTGVTSTITSVHNYVVESVQVTVNITHDFVTDLGIELTSPNGTKSILMNINSGVLDADMTNVTFLSNAFYGESSRGAWKLKVIDGYSQEIGTLDNWSLNIIGHVEPNPIDIVDPDAPVITTADATTVASLATSPVLAWTAPAAADVMRYEIAIGTTLVGTEILNWESVGTALTKTKSGLSLVDGTVYYMHVRAVDTSENASVIDTISWTADI